VTSAAPIEVAAVDEDAADGGAVAAEPLGERLDDDGGAVLDRAAQIRRREGVVHEERDVERAPELGEPGDVGNVEARVADRLDEPGLGRLVARRREALGIGGLDEAHVDAEPPEGVQEDVPGAAVQRRGRDDAVAGASDVEKPRTSAAWPDDTASAACRREAAMRCSSTSLVGFMMRE
jgi:hypothetical protein